MIVIYRNKWFYVYDNPDESTDFELGYEIIDKNELSNILASCKDISKNLLTCQSILNTFCQSDAVDTFSVIDTLKIAKHLNKIGEYLNVKDDVRNEIVNNFLLETHCFQVIKLENGTLTELDEGMLSQKIKMEIAKYTFKNYLNQTDTRYLDIMSAKRKHDIQDLDIPCKRVHL